MNKLNIDVLVLGMGNFLMSDDGLGVHFINVMQNNKEFLNAALLEVGTTAINYIDVISQANNIIAVDAIKAGGMPGDVYCFKINELVHHLDTRLDAHGYSLLDVIAVAQAMTQFPKKVIACGIEPKNCAFGTQLTLTVKRSLPKLINNVCLLIDELRNDAVSGCNTD